MDKRQAEGYVAVTWTVTNHDAFDPEFNALPVSVREEILVATGLLESFGPMLGRPF